MWVRIMSLSGMVVLWGLCSGLVGAEEFGPPLPGTKPLTMTRRYRQRAGRGRRPVPLEADRRIDRQASRHTGSAISPPPGRTTPRSSPTASGWRISWGCAITRAGDSERVWTIRGEARSARTRGPGYWNISWPAFGDVTGEGLLESARDRRR